MWYVLLPIHAKLILKILQLYSQLKNNSESNKTERKQSNLQAHAILMKSRGTFPTANQIMPFRANRTGIVIYVLIQQGEIHSVLVIRVG